MALEIRTITSANLPDAARLCTAGTTLGDRPKGFSREVELESTRCKLSMLRTKMGTGAKGFAAYNEGMLVGYLETHPVERSVVPIEGAGFHVIQCMRVPEVSERAETEAALVEAAAAALAATGGMAVLARDHPWNVMGFTEIERDASEVQGEERVLWFRKLGAGTPPKFVPVMRNLPKPPGKARLDLFTNDRCPWDKFVFDMVRAVAAARAKDFAIFETDCTKRREVLRYGVTAAIALNGNFQPWVRPYRLPDEHTIRRTLEAVL